MFSGVSSSPYFTTNWFCLLFFKFQSFAAMIHLVAINSSLEKNIGWYRLLYFIVTLSSLIYYFLEVKFHKNERYPERFFDLIISQHQFLLDYFIRLKMLELLNFSHHYFMGRSPRSKNLNVIKTIFKIGIL